MSGLLLFHIISASLLLVVFLVRYVMVIAGKAPVTAGRWPIAVLGVAMLGSGVALEITRHSSLTHTCTVALEIIGLVVVLEGVLQVMARRLPFVRR